MYQPATYVVVPDGWISGMHGLVTTGGGVVVVVDTGGVAFGGVANCKATPLLAIELEIELDRVAIIGCNCLLVAVIAEEIFLVILFAVLASAVWFCVKRACIPVYRLATT
jgi:hypothetical protein